MDIYKYLSFLGESYKLPVFWALVVLGSYPMIMHWLFNVSLPDDFLTYLRENAASFFQMDTKYIGERIIGIPILGLLPIALKRQFERKK